ncbi:MAG TPA: hypothetical protein VGX21_10280 [Methylomirabilota bacterium]|jgi:hypothetical protein|nr:hypothetical protein [Methylomirabilota bacterium]
MSGARGDSGGGRGRRLTAAAILLVGIQAGAAGPAAADEWTVRTGVHADAWSGVGQKGHQILAPTSLAFDTPAWGLSVRTAYGTSERDPATGPTGSITGFTDTTVSGYYRLTVSRIELRAGLDLDLPTGVSRLRTSQIAAVQDDDLVLLRRFGEGFDLNGSLSAYRNFGAFGLGLGVGYLRTGEYDPTSDPNDDIDPGDELTVAALADVYATDTIRLILRAAYTYFTADERRGGVDALREGDEVDLLVTTEWRPEPWWVAVTLRGILRDKAERANAVGQLVPESRNSNGDEIRGRLTAGYILNDVWAVSGTVEVRHVAANDFPAGDPLHDGGRTKVAFGPSVAWTPTRTFGAEAAFRYFIMDVKQSPFFQTDGTIHGVHVDVRLTYRF